MDWNGMKEAIPSKNKKGEFHCVVVCVVIVSFLLLSAPSSSFSRSAVSPSEWRKMSSDWRSSFPWHHKKYIKVVWSVNFPFPPSSLVLSLGLALWASARANLYHKYKRFMVIKWRWWSGREGWLRVANDWRKLIISLWVDSMEAEYESKRDMDAFECKERLFCSLFMITHNKIMMKKAFAVVQRKRKCF